MPAAALSDRRMTSFSDRLRHNGPRMLGLMHLVLNSARSAANGDHADLGCVEAFADAVADPAWDDGDAFRLLCHAAVAADRLQSSSAAALSDDGGWQVETGSDALGRAAWLSSGVGRLGAAMATLQGRCGTRATLLDLRAASRGLPDLGCEDIKIGQRRGTMPRHAV